jgi:uncharacterized membrane protein YcaP (DUF421 family)
MDALFGIKDHITLGQECARAVVVFFYGLILLRLSGRRTFAQWSALDIVISIVVGSSLARAMTASAPFGGTLAAVALLILLHTIFAFAVSRSERLSDIVEGNAVSLAQEGCPDHEARRRHLISNEDLEQALRQRGVERVDQTKAIHLEADGKISVIKTDA